MAYPSQGLTFFGLALHFLLLLHLPPLSNCRYLRAPILKNMPCKYNRLFFLSLAATFETIENLVQRARAHMYT
jgi:hypothetical protein